MKKLSFRKRNSTLSRSSLGAGIVVAFIALLILIRLAAPDFFFSITAPFWSAGTSLANAFHQTFSGFSHTDTLVRERDTLAAENESLKNQIHTLESDTVTAHELFGTSTSESGVIADVIVRPPFSPYDVLVINRGSGSGIVVGATVTAFGGVPVGTVATVSKTAAQVSLFSAPHTETEGWVGAKHTPLTLTGSGAGTFDATLPKDVPVAEGDAVLLAGFRTPIGTVTRIDTNPSSPSKIIRIQSFVNLFSIVQVQVLSPHSL